MGNNARLEQHKEAGTQTLLPGEGCGSIATTLNQLSEHAKTLRTDALNCIRKLQIHTLATVLGTLPVFAFAKPWRR